MKDVLLVGVFWHPIYIYIYYICVSAEMVAGTAPQDDGSYTNTRRLMKSCSPLSGMHTRQILKSIHKLSCHLQHLQEFGEDGC